MRFDALILVSALAVGAQIPDSVVTPSAPVLSVESASDPDAAVPAILPDTIREVAPLMTDSGLARVASDSSGSPDSLARSAVPMALPSVGPMVAATVPGDSVKTTATPPRRSSLKRLPQVAVLSFTGDGVQAKDLAAVTSRFETELLATDSFKVVERRNVDRILKEQGFQLSGVCDNSECSVEIGQILSVDGIWTGELAKVGKTWSLSVKRTEVGTGQTVFSHVLDIQGSLEDVLRGGCPEMALIASGRKTPESSRTVLVAKKGNMWPWVVGGAVAAGGAVAVAILLTQDDGATNTPTVGNRTVEITFDTGK